MGLFIDQKRRLIAASGCFNVSVEPLATHGANEFVALLGEESAFIFRPFDVSFCFTGQEHLHRLDHEFLEFICVQI